MTALDLLPMPSAWLERNAGKLEITRDGEEIFLRLASGKSARWRFVGVIDHATNARTDGEDGDEALLTPVEVCDALRISRQTLGRRINEGAIKAVRFGPTIRIPTAELARIINSQNGGSDG